MNGLLVTSESYRRGGKEPAILCSQICQALVKKESRIIV